MMVFDLELNIFIEFLVFNKFHIVIDHENVHKNENKIVL